MKYERKIWGLWIEMFRLFTTYYDKTFSDNF